MFDNFLSDLLKIIVVLDIIGIIAYFLLGILRKKKFPDSNHLPETVARTSNNIFGNYSNSLSNNELKYGNRRTSIWRRLSDRRANKRSQQSLHAPCHGDLESSFVDLRRILNSFCEGIA